MTADQALSWFERLTGFREEDHATTQGRLQVDGTRLRSTVNGRSWSIGSLELVSLQTLRERARSHAEAPGQLRVRVLEGDARALHQQPALRGALFQVASQFNLLEMTFPHVTPEHGVTGYQDDRTQGPACAIAAGAATLYRNYRVPVDGGEGQTAERQLDGLADLGVALSQALALPVSALWTMRNGYALCSDSGLQAITTHLAGLSPGRRDALRARLRIGVHSDVEVTDSDTFPGPRVSQAFCSALPVSYSRVPRPAWQAFATLVLEAAYEATLWAALANAQRGGSRTVLLTRLGGGAFGNDPAWIDAAMQRALRLFQGIGLDVCIVSHGAPLPSMVALAASFD
jgi:hypothetical protein